MLILDGHKSHISAEFDNYCEANKIIPLCLLPRSSHLTQPLDVGCFGSLKRAYGDEINKFSMEAINHITKDDFLIVFRAAYFKAITTDNIRGGFRGAGLILQAPESIISKSDMKSRTPTPADSPSLENPWTSQTPCNPKDAVSQVKLVIDQIAKQRSSSPTLILTASGSMAKVLI